MKEKVNYKVCHLLYESFPADPRIRRYVNALTENNIYSIIICSKSKGSKYVEKYRDNLIYRIPISKHRQSFFLTATEYIGFTFLASFLLIYLGIKYGFKIIHTHTLPDFLLFAGILNKIFGAKLILDLHELFPEVFMARKPQLQNSIFVKILKFQERISIKLADLVITIHEPAKHIFLKRNKGLEKKIFIIMNGVDPNEINNKDRVITDKFIMIYNGTVVKLWNLQLAVKSINLLKTKMPEEDYRKIIFKIYGQGPVLNETLLLAKELHLEDKVVFAGLLPSSKMYEEVLKANVCILPALKNIYTDLFYTIKLTEMIYFKIPVIAARLNTYKYYYSEESLFYFDSGNEEQLAEKMKEVFYNKELVKQKTENAFRDYQKVAWEIMKTRYLDIVKGLLSQ